MTEGKLTRGLGAVLGIGFVAFGLVETGIAVSNGDGIALFWFPALCGGGTLVLLGVFRVLRPRSASIALVSVGALAASLATVWTVLLPILAVTLVVLVIRRPVPVGEPAVAA